MKRWLPKSLAGQLIGVLLLALVVAQSASLMILHDDRRLAFAFVAQQEVMSRTASVVRLLKKTEPALHQTVVEAASSRRLRFQLADTSAVSPDDADDGFNRFLKRRLKWELSGESDEVRVAISDDDDEDDEDDRVDGRGDHRSMWMGSDERRFSEWRSSHFNMMRFNHRRWRHRPGMTLSIATSNSPAGEAWLNVYSVMPSTGPSVAVPSLITLAIMAVLLIVTVILMVRRVTRPLAELSRNAERFGRGEDIDLLSETGPEDIRKASRTFNEMQERLTRFVRDRTRMLAAITHDLRTPITAMRIRAEMIEDEDNRQKILETLAEMQSLTDTALDFARHEATNEDSRTVDLVALVESLCADMTDLGQAVEFVAGTPERFAYACRPGALKRVLRNLIENALRYGEAAKVSVMLEGTDICIDVADHGPGIAEQDRERIFEPFVRLEASRSQETGGIGLGLAIARGTVRAHGGDIVVSAGESGGAVFSVRLPLQD